MITEDYVNFEIAKLLKERGFDGECMCMYVTPKPHSGMGNPNEAKIAPHGRDNRYYDGYLYQCEAPTLQMAMKWLREVHKLHISVVMGFDVDNSQYFFYVPSVCRFSNKSGEYQTPFGEKEFGSYEEACEAVIKYCLENLI